MQNASWLALKQTRPCSRSPSSTTGIRVIPSDSTSSSARDDRVLGRDPRRVGAHVRLDRPVARRPARRPASSVPRKRSPSVTSSSFLRGLTNTSRASASGVAGPTVSRPAHHHVADGGPGLVDRDVDRFAHGSPKCGARFSRNAATPSRPSGAPASPAIVRASSASCSRERRASQVSRSSRLTAPWAPVGPSASRRASASASASSSSSAHHPRDEPELVRARRRLQPLVEQHQLGRAAQADEPRQRPARAAVGREADRGVGHREARRLGGEHEVGGDRDAHPAARRGAADGADHRRVERRQRLDPGVERASPAADGVARPRRPRRA